MAATLQPPHQAGPRSRSRSKSASGREKLEKIQKHLPPNVSENITKVTKIVDKLSGHEPRTNEAGTYTGTSPPTSYQEYHQQNGMNSNYTYGASSHGNSQLPYDQQRPYGVSPQPGGHGNSHATAPAYQSSQHLQPPPPSTGCSQQNPSSSQADLSLDPYTYGTSPAYQHFPSPSPGPPTMSGGASSAPMSSSSGKTDGKSTTTAKLASKAEKLLLKQVSKSGKKKNHGMGFGHSGVENGEGGEGEYGEEDGEHGGDEGDWGGDLAGGMGEGIGENLSGGDGGGGDDGGGLGEVLGAIFGG